MAKKARVGYRLNLCLGRGPCITARQMGIIRQRNMEYGQKKKSLRMNSTGAA